jgi:hypothetical protein
MVKVNLKQTGKEVNTKKTFERKTTFAVAGGICTSKDVTDPELKDSPFMFYKKELINY